MFDTKDTSVITLPLDRIETKGMQTRAALRQNAIDEYAERIKSGETMDPAVVFAKGERYLLAAGFHRMAAYEKAGQEAMPCVVKQGSVWEAIEFGIRENQRHVGERLSQADKRHNVKLVLSRRSNLTNCLIAELCGVSDKTVQKYRAAWEASQEIPESQTRIGRDGRTYDVTALTSQKGERSGGADSVESKDSDHEASLDPQVNAPAVGATKEGESKTPTANARSGADRVEKANTDDDSLDRQVDTPAVDAAQEDGSKTPAGNARSNADRVEKVGKEDASLDRQVDTPAVGPASDDRRNTPAANARPAATGQAGGVQPSSLQSSDTKPLKYHVARLIKSFGVCHRNVDQLMTAVQESGRHQHDRSRYNDICRNLESAGGIIDEWLKEVMEPGDDVFDLVKRFDSPNLAKLE